MNTVSDYLSCRLSLPAPKSISNLKNPTVCKPCFSAILCRRTKMKISMTVGSLEIIWHQVDARYTVHHVPGFFINSNEILLPSPTAKLSPLVIKSKLLLLEQVKFLNYISFMADISVQWPGLDRQEPLLLFVLRDYFGFIQIWPVKIKDEITF